MTGMANPRYVKGRDGKFQGSIGDGKTNVPTASHPHGYTSAEMEAEAPITTAFARYQDIVESQVEDTEVEDTMSNEDVMVLFNISRGDSGDRDSDDLTGYLAVSNSLDTDQQIFLTDQMRSETRNNLARFTSTHPAVLEHLSHSDYHWIRMKVVANPSTPTDVVVQMVEDDLDDVDSYGDICASAASNPSLPLNLLESLTEHEEDAVRLAVAYNPSATSATLDYLNQDENSEIREAVARATNSPDTLEFMATDSRDNANVLERIAANPYTPPEVLAQLATHESEFVQSEVAGNSYTPPEALDKLARSPYAGVKHQVVRNSNTSLETLAGLAETCLTPSIRQDAEDQLEEIAQRFPDLVKKAYATARGDYE